MARYDTIVIKIGSSTLTNEKGKLDLPNLKRIVKEVADLKKKVIIVTSGSIVTGSERLGLKTKPKTIPEKQSAAAVGQAILMRQYDKAFEAFGVTVAQVLLTRDELSGGERKFNAKNCLHMLLKEGVVPVINENDAVAVEEIKVGDNDTLSALVSVMIEADLLVLLTDVDGFYLSSDEGIPYKVEQIDDINNEVEDAAGHPSTQLGIGGMKTKIQAAKICKKAGIPVIIAHGRTTGVIQKIAAGEKVGTKFI
ncbi:glutamate 5-kinase [Candidatus Saganbacteria bacterium]|nr:glutamate 5-kinase [Candidatus Saganbacteria bacterium]